ncbi:hypothetical protein MHU86_351 [Fragilaria crotonensis]|nr:hypothetical protein MHU86_351 [Fragilaria crotonensis]
MNFLQRIFLWTWTLSISTQAALTARELALGDWNLMIQTTRRSLDGEPIASSIFPESSMTTRRLNCRLSLFPNGNFTIVLEGKDVMPINGRWELGRNPYCPTDRFYDDLILESYPRARKRTGDGQVLQRVGFLFKCRIYGRYSGHERRLGRINHGTLLRKDHLADVPNTLVGWWKQRPVIASFTGRPVEVLV